jgi:hypothetical protein
LYKKALFFLPTKNTSVCNATRKLFGEIINHFILVGDETNLIADANGELKIVGGKGKKKHEKKVSAYRGSITMYHTGVAARHNDPPVFLLKCKKQRCGYNNMILKQEDCAVVSTVTMTKNAYMTEEHHHMLRDIAAYQLYVTTCNGG